MAAINGFTRTKVDRFVVLKFSNSFERTKPAHENHVSPKRSRKPTRQTFSEMNPDNLMPLALGNHEPECSDVILRDLFICRNCRHFLRMLRRQTRLYHTCLQHSSPTPLQCFYTTLLSNISPQHSVTTLPCKTSPKHFFTTLFSNTSLQHSSPTLLPKIPLQDSSPRPLYKTFLQHSSPTALQFSTKKEAQVLSPTAFGELCKQRKSARTSFSNSWGSK